MATITGYTVAGADGKFATIGSGGGGGGSDVGVALDSFTGATDDAKLTAAISYAAAQTYPPAIRWANRAYSHTTQRTVYQGLRFIGPFGGGISNAQLSDNAMVNKVQLNTNGTWLNVASDVFSCSIIGFAFIGTSNTTFMGGSGLFHGSLIRDVSFKSFKTVLGTQAQKLLMTTTLIDGWFQVQGTYNGGVHIGGSDNYVFMSGALFDATPAYASAGGVAGQFHLWFDGLDNTHVGRIYVTAEGPWGGCKITGSDYNVNVPSNLATLYIENPILEGRNASTPCYGSVLRVEGGIVRVNGGYLGRGMSNPSAMGHSPQDAGGVHVTGGALLLNGTIFDRYTGQPETSPFVYNNGGTVRVRDIWKASKGGVWTGKPRVQNVTAGGGSIVADDSVTVV